MTAIRLMSDWGLQPFYIQRDDGVFYNTSAEVIEQELGVPRHVIDVIEAWDAQYQELLDWSDPASSGWAHPDDATAFRERGREVAALLRRHLPPEVGLQYCGDDLIPTEHV